MYILASDTRSLYIGVTNNIVGRICEHGRGLHPHSYAHAHAATRLVCLERCGDVRDAIRREKQLKGWSRRKKPALINAQNPEWVNLAAGVI